MGTIQNLLLGPEEIVGRSAKDNCFFVGAVLYGYRVLIMGNVPNILEMIQQNLF
jgi:hypothetical protein